MARDPGRAGQPRLPARSYCPVAPDTPEDPQGPQFDDEVAAAERSHRELQEAMERAESNPRAVQILLARLETDPYPDIRKAVAWHLLPRVHEENVGEALRAASAEDEDVEVRWIARYALLLANRGAVRLPD